VGQSFMTFMPVLFVQEGFTIVSAGIIFSLFTVAGTISGLMAGAFSDRIGFKPVFYVTHGLMTPVLLLFLQLSGGWVYAGAALAGGIVLATLPLGVVMAQSLAPRGRSMVGSLMMGFAFGLGGLVAPLVGKLADLYSVRVVLTGISLIPLVTLFLIARFPSVDRPTA
jgi:FSR family fosmidomycin resistance protein-like MFS transporter